MMEVPIPKRGWDDLTPLEKELRINSRKVLFEVQSGKSLEAASHDHHIHPESVRRHIDGFVKKNGRWCVKRVVKNEVVMTVYTHGKTRFVPVPDIKDASVIGCYHNAVKEYLQTGEQNVLAPFIGNYIRGTDGTTYVLETDPRALYEIKERQPEEEYFSIYRRG